MKISIDIDCSPAEARAALGLPDLEGVNKLVAKELEARMADALKAMEPERLMKAWFPAGLEGVGELQRQFLDALAKQAKGGR